MDVLIVGAGAMGRWFADVLDDPVVFSDIDEEVAHEAAKQMEGRSIPLEADTGFDLVCLAVPISVVSEAIETHAPRARQAVVDVSGVMNEPLQMMAEHAPDRERLSLHPLFAPERAPGRIAYVHGSGGSVSERILSALEADGNDLVSTTAERHDTAMETVQATTHAAILSFALATDPVADELTTPVYEQLSTLTEQVTGGTPDVYVDIQETFEGATDLANAAEMVASADREQLREFYIEAAHRWQRDRSDD